MGCACRSLERVDALSEVRTMAHQHLDAWLDQLAPLLEQPRAPTLQELSGLFTRTRGQLLGGCLQALTEALYGELREQRQMDCPGCSRRLSRKRLDPKQLNTLQGTFSLQRPYFHCRECNRGYHPLDQALELARAFHQYDVQEKVLKLATEMPYERAAQLVSELTGVAVSNHLGHATLSRVAEIADLDTVIPDEAEIRRRIEQARASAQDKPILVVALDGAHAPTRSRARRNQKRGTGQWREVKGIRLYLAPTEGRIIQLASWHQIQDAEAMRRDLHQIAARIPQQAVRIALLGDGAAWVWNTLGECFPAARQVLDYYHCSEHLHKLAESQYDEPAQAAQWVEATLARLSQDRVSHVIGGIRRMLPRSVAALEERDRLITYLQNQSGRLGYDACRKQGIPVGSGGIESANKFISHVRLKRSGAWWVVENGNAMLRLRCAMYNGTFERVFEKYRAIQREEVGTIW